MEALAFCGLGQGLVGLVGSVEPTAVLGHELLIKPAEGVSLWMTTATVTWTRRPVRA